MLLLWKIPYGLGAGGVDAILYNCVALHYSRSTVLRYVQKKCIYAVKIMGKYYISKQSIINYLATDKAFKNTQKTSWHIAVIERFLENG